MRAAWVAVAVIGLIGCSGGTDRAAEPAPTSATASPTTVAAPMTTTTAAPPAFECTAAVGESTDTLASGGLDRTYQLEVPAGLTAPAPLILNLHGYGSNAIRQVFYSRLPEQGGDRGVMVVTPDGQGATEHWNFLPAGAEANDYEFLSALLDRLVATGCVDEDRIYAAGISNGSAMSAFLACAFNDRLAAVGLVAATVQPVGCAADQTMPVIAFHGTDDPLVPYGGGAVSAGGSSNGITVSPAEEAMASWAAQDGCATTPVETSVASDVTLLEFPDCPAGLALRLYRVEGGGHTWPGSIAVDRLGVTTSSIDATALMLDFFAAHTRSGR